MAIMFSFPSWANDGNAAFLTDNSGIRIRAAWGQVGGTAKDMHDKDGDRPFFFPGKATGYPNVAPDFDRLNPAYFDKIDKKFKYLWDNGFYAYVESVRRDHGPVWYNYHNWKISFSRYLVYLRARFGTMNYMYSLIHDDTAGGEDYGLSGAKWNEAINYYRDTYGPMPFGQLTTAMGGWSTYAEYGNTTWLEVHTAGNAPRNHATYTQILQFYTMDHVPGFINEPYYLRSQRDWNHVNGENPSADSQRDQYFARTHMWGGVFSGALVGHQYGTVAWNATVEGNNPGSDDILIWNCLNWNGLKQVQYLKPFIESEGSLFQQLVPASQNLNPQFSGANLNNNLDGRAHMLIHPDKLLCFLYFENKCDKASVSGLLANKTYNAQWYNPRTGEWSDIGNGKLTANSSGVISMPNFPGDLGQTADNNDWAAKLKEENYSSVTLKPEIKINSRVRGSLATFYFEPQDLPEMQLSIYNEKGQELEHVLVNKNHVGEGSINCNFNECAPGIYYLRVKNNSLSHTKKFILMR